MMTQFGATPRTSGPLWKKLEARARGEQPAPAAYPTAMAVAAAVVTAARQHNADPFEYVSGRVHGCDGRYTAYWALLDLFPAHPETLAKLVGAKRPEAFVKKAARGRGEFYWWSEDAVDDVKAAVLKRAA